MNHPIEPRRVAETMLSWLELELISCTELQALWAGYGQICAVRARPRNDKIASQWCAFTSKEYDGHGAIVHLVLKLISPPSCTNDEGHLRKMFSYGVEQSFYDDIAPHLGDGAAVPKCLASTAAMRERATEDGLDGLLATLLSDLSLEYPIAGEKRSVLSQIQVLAALRWLAMFHAASRAKLPTTLDGFLLPPLKEAERRQSGHVPLNGPSLWLNGGYTYLATRRKEYASLSHDKHSEWSDAFCGKADGASASVAEMIADFLTPSGSPYETLLHGDVKSENLFSTVSGDRVAFCDFQYTGIGLGVCDLAKLFTCSVPLDLLIDGGTIPNELEMGKGERALLEHYREILLGNRPTNESRDYEWDLFCRHWETALVDWCRFQASWGFWGNTEWLEARTRFILQDPEWKAWLCQQL